MNKEKKNPKWLSVLLAVICVLLSLVLISNLIVIIKGAINPDRPPSAFGFTSMIVLSGSMSGDAPDHIEVGDMIVTRSADPKTLEVGDVITFMEEGTTAVTHRIIGINEDGSFITKGDANNTEDRIPVQHEQIIGKFMFRIPKLGDIAMFAQTPLGMLIFIGLPLAAYIILDLVMRARQNKNKKTADEQSKAENEELKAELERLRSQLAEEKDSENQASEQTEKKDSEE